MKYSSMTEVRKTSSDKSLCPCLRPGLLHCLNNCHWLKQQVWTWREPRSVHLLVISSIGILSPLLPPPPYGVALMEVTDPTRANKKQTKTRPIKFVLLTLLFTSSNHHLHLHHLHHCHHRHCHCCCFRHINCCCHGGRKEHQEQ